MSKKWTLRADVSLTWDDATGSSTDPSVPAAEPTADAEKPQTARVQGGMLADDDDATSSSGDDEEVEVAAAPAAPAKTPTAEPAKKKTSDAFGLAYTPYEVYDAAPAQDAESSDDESDAESATAAPANSPPVASQATGDAPDLPSDKVRSLDSAPPPKNANNGKPRAGAKAPPPAPSRRTGRHPPRPRRRQQGARTFSRRVRPTNRRWQFQGLRPRGFSKDRGRLPRARRRGPGFKRRRLGEHQAARTRGGRGARIE